MMIIAHRGASGSEPENTIFAFKSALDMQVDGIELDVHLTADNQVIVIHDETLDRTTDATGEIKSQTFAAIRNALINTKHRIPLLSEVFDLVNKSCFINIELKGDKTAEPVMKIIEKYVTEKNWSYSHFIISSFDWVALQQIRILNDQIPIGVLTMTDLDLAVAFAYSISAHKIIAYHHLLNAKNVENIKHKGYKISAWTVNELEDIKRMKAIGVDGIITDFPNRI